MFRGGGRHRHVRVHACDHAVHPSPDAQRANRVFLMLTYQPRFTVSLLTTIILKKCFQMQVHLQLFVLMHFAFAPMFFVPTSILQILPLYLQLRPFAC